MSKLYKHLLLDSQANTVDKRNHWMKSEMEPKVSVKMIVTGVTGVNIKTTELLKRLESMTEQ